jgi:hypothetical protein
MDEITRLRRIIIDAFYYGFTSISDQKADAILQAVALAMSCDPCLAAEDAALSFVASGDASAVCGDCGEDLMGGGPHGAGCPLLCRLCEIEEAVEGDRNGYCAACAAEDAECGK